VSIAKALTHLKEKEGKWRKRGGTEGRGGVPFPNCAVWERCMNPERRDKAR